MAISIVKISPNTTGDMDFLAFSFNGKHSWDDFHIYRTSEGDRYNENLTPTLTDKTAEVPGSDGMYYFGTTHKQKDFNISFAFDSLTDVQLRKLKKWLNGKEMGDLWFQETPYKVWTAKPTGNLSIKYIPFNDKNGERVYKGEGTVQFVAYWPYAHTPDWACVRSDVFLVNTTYQIWDTGKKYRYVRLFTKETSIQLSSLQGTLYVNDIEYEVTRYPHGFIWSYHFDLGEETSISSIKFIPQENAQYPITEVNCFASNQVYQSSQPYSSDKLEWYEGGNGKSAQSYDKFYDQSLAGSGITDLFQTGYNCGDLPAPFVLKVPSISNQENASEITLAVGELEITIPAKTKTLQADNVSYEYTHHSDIEWNSKTGLVYATIDDERKLIPFTGNSLGGIPTEGISNWGLKSISGSTITYDHENMTLDYHYWYY